MTRELVLRVTIDDCEVQTFRCGKHGGQRGDKKDTGVRIVHPPSGAVGESREERSQIQNKKIAFGRMAKTKEFQLWNRMTAMKYPSIDEVVREQLEEKNLVIEGKDSRGRWSPINECSG